MNEPYSIHDLKHQGKIIHHYYEVGMAAARGRAMLSGAGLSAVVEPFDLALAFGRLRRRYERHMGMTSKYMPHQGQRECARRIRQGKA